MQKSIPNKKQKIKTGENMMLCLCLHLHWVWVCLGPGSGPKGVSDCVNA